MGTGNSRSADASLMTLELLTALSTNFDLDHNSLPHWRAFLFILFINNEIEFLNGFTQWKGGHVFTTKIGISLRDLFVYPVGESLRKRWLLCYKSNKNHNSLKHYLKILSMEEWVWLANSNRCMIASFMTDNIKHFFFLKRKWQHLMNLLSLVLSAL